MNSGKSGLRGYLTRNPGKRAMVEGALAWTSSPDARREDNRTPQTDEAAQAAAKPSDVGL